MNSLIKLKKQLFSQFSVRKISHYCRDLRTLTAGDLSATLNYPEIAKDFKINHYSEVPYDLIKALGVEMKFNNKSDTGCLFAMYGAEPIGCILLNLDSRGQLLEPFKYEFSFQKKHVYAHTLFVKQEYRSKGIAKILYQESFSLLKGKFNHLDVWVDTEQFITNRMSEELGFKKISELVLIKFMSLKLKLNLNNSLKKILFSSLYSFLKPLYKIFTYSFAFLISLFRKTNEFINNFFLTCYLITGTEAKSAVKVAFISSDEIYGRVIFNKLFQNGYEVKKNKRFLRAKLVKEFINISKETDLVIVDGAFDYLYQMLHFVKDAKFMPQWVTQKNYSFEKLNEFKGRKNKSASEDIREVKNHNYSYIFTRSRQLLKFFYENMYLPFIEKRFGNEKSNASFELIERSFKNGGLLLVKDGEKYISGAVIELKNKVFHPMFLGILNGDTSFLKKDALSATYYFELKLAQDKGFKIVDFGLSRAFLNDGVLRYKAKWNTKIEFDKRRSNVFVFKIFHFSEPVNNFLKNNPFISIEKNDLFGNIYADLLTCVDTNEIIKKYRFNGLSELKITTLGAESIKDTKYLNNIVTEDLIASKF